jgi:oxaloacetate decarboxylase gamma subunit
MIELVAPGLELSLIGMTIVFIFLTMLILAVNIMSATILRFFPETPVDVEKVTTDEIEPDVLAAISAAIHQHRAKHTK